MTGPGFDLLPDGPLYEKHIRALGGLSPVASYVTDGWTQAIWVHPPASFWGLDYHPVDGWYMFPADSAAAVTDALAERRVGYDVYETTEGIDR